MAIDTIISTGGAGFFTLHAADSSIEDMDAMGERLADEAAAEYREELGDLWTGEGHGYAVDSDPREVSFRIGNANPVHGEMLTSGSEG